MMIIVIEIGSEEDDKDYCGENRKIVSTKMKREKENTHDAVTILI